MISTLCFVGPQLEFPVRFRFLEIRFRLFSRKKFEFFGFFGFSGFAYKGTPNMLKK